MEVRKRSRFESCLGPHGGVPVDYVVNRKRCRYRSLPQRGHIQALEDTSNLNTVAIRCDVKHKEGQCLNMIIGIGISNGIAKIPRS